MLARAINRADDQGAHREEESKWDTGIHGRIAPPTAAVLHFLIGDSFGYGY